MGQVKTPKYAVEMGGFYRMSPFTSAWHGHLPTVKRLEQYVMEFVVSTMPGYCNERVGQAYGIAMPSYAIVRENKQGGAVLTRWDAPAFMALPRAEDYPKVARVVAKGRN